MEDTDQHAGKRVIYTDPVGVQHEAIVTRCWGDRLGVNAINVVYVSQERTEQDQYGRQIKRETSVAAKGQHGAAPGRFYEVPE